MKRFARLLLVVLALLPAIPARALDPDRILPALRIKPTGDVMLDSRLRIGRDRGGKFVSTPENLEGLSLTSPLDVDAYASGSVTGKAAFTLNSKDDSAVSGKERYGAWIAYTGKGTGDPAVIGSHFALGLSSLKQNWFENSTPGQTIGINIVTRGGYHGSDANSAPAQFGGYMPAGDTSAIIANSVVSSKYSQNALLEGVAHYAEKGAFAPSGDVHSINVQLAPMRQKNPDGSAANPGIGLALSADNGALGYAIQAVNKARSGSYAILPSTWQGFARYNFDDGTRAPYDAFRVDQDGSVYLNSGNATTPSKRLRVGSGGNFEILNHAGSPSMSVSDTGALTVGVGANAKAVLTTPGAWTAYNGALQFDSASTAAGTYTARYELTGKRLTLSGSFAVTSAGSDAKFGVYVPLPAGSAIASVCPGVGSEFAVTGKMLNVRGQGAATRLTLTNYDNTSTAVANAQGMFSVVCEIQ